MNAEERPEDAARRLAGELLTVQRRAFTAELDRNVAQAALIEATKLITEMLSEFDTMKYLGWVPTATAEQWRTHALALSVIASPNATDDDG